MDPVNAEADIVGWATAVCVAPSASADDVTTALGMDPARVARVGSQVVCPPPPGTDLFEIVVDSGSGVVASVEVGLAPRPPLSTLTAALGPARVAPPGPHDLGRTVLFDFQAPSRAARPCTVIAWLDAVDAGPRPDDPVAALTLLLDG